MKKKASHKKEAMKKHEEYKRPHEKEAMKKAEKEGMKKGPMMGKKGC